MKFNIENTKEVANNVVILQDEDGKEMQFSVTDEVMEAVLTMCQTGKVVRPASTAESNTKLKVAIEEITVNGKKFYQIRNQMFYGTGKKACTAYQLGNSKIKALNKIQTIELVRKDGNGSFKAWGYWKKSDASKALTQLPEYITAAEIAAKKATYNN